MLTDATTFANPTTAAALDLSHLAPRLGECERETPCDRAGYPYASMRCNACHARLIARIDATLAWLVERDLSTPYDPTPAELAEARDPRDHDQFLGEDERAMEALAVPDSAWAADNLDPGPAAGEFAELWA